MRTIPILRSKDLDLRTSVQKQGTALCIEGNVLLSYPTGFGKTKTVSDAITTLLKENVPIYFVTSRVVLIENTKKDFIKYNLDPSLITFLCYQSLKNIVEKGVFILDEVHNITDNYVEPIIEYSLKTIALTATLPKEKEYLLQALNINRKHVVTLQMAIDEGILPMPQLKWHSIPLDNTEKKYKLTRFTGAKGKKPTKKTPIVELDYKDYWTNDYPDSLLVFYLTAKSYYEHIDKEVAYFMKQANNPRKPFAKRIFQQKALNRKKWLSEYKFPFLVELLKESEAKKILVYLNNISQCEELNYPSYHSKNSIAENEEILDSFILGLYPILTSVNSLKEGQNIAEIEEAFILQLDNVKDKPHNFIQIVGRALRGDNPVVHIFFVPETQDEKYYLKTLTKWI